MLHFVYVQPLWNLAIFGVAMLVGWTFFCVKFDKAKKLCSRIALVLSVLLVFYMTLFGREATVHFVELRPFYTFVLAQNQVEYYRSFFMNGLLFVPFGLSLPYVLRQDSFKRKLLITLGVAAALSVGVEILQYLYHLGRCEIDDLIANTLGTAIGSLSYLCYLYFKKQKQ